MMQRWLVNSCIPFLLLGASCGDGGSGGGFGAIGGAFGGGSGSGSEPTAFLYVTNSGSNNISGFSINTTTGGLVALSGSPFPTGSGPSAIALSSNGLVAYVANRQANTVTAFAISTGGGLSQLSSTATNTSPGSVGINPSALALSSEADVLYVANRDSVGTFSIGTGGVLSLVAQTGGRTNPLPVVGSSTDSLALSSDGKFLYVGNHSSNEITAFSIDASGLLTKISPAGANTNPLATGGSVLQGIASSPTALFLYAIHNSSSPVVVFRIESNGLLTRVPSSGGRANPLPDGIATPSAVILSRDGRFLYSANGDGTITVFGVGGDGLLSLVSNGNPGSAGTSPVAMTLSPDGLYLYVANSGGRISAYSVARDTGLLTPLSPLIGNPFPAGVSPSGMATSGSR